MRIWRYGVVVRSPERKPELYKKTITRIGALWLAEGMMQALRTNGLLPTKVEVWSRNKIEESNIDDYKFVNRVKVYE